MKTKTNKKAKKAKANKTENFSAPVVADDSVLPKMYITQNGYVYELLGKEEDYPEVKLDIDLTMLDELERLRVDGHFVNIPELVRHSIREMMNNTTTTTEDDYIEINEINCCKGQDECNFSCVSDTYNTDEKTSCEDSCVSDKKDSWFKRIYKKLFGNN